MPPPSRQEAGLALPHSHPQNQITSNHHHIQSWLRCAAQGKSRLSHSDDLGASSPACHRWQGTRVRGDISPSNGRQVVGPAALPSSRPQNWLTPTPTIRGSSTVLPRQGAGPALSAAVGEGRACSPALVAPGSGLLPAADSKRRGSKSISPSLMPAHSRQVVGPAHLCPCYQHRLYCAAQARCRAALLNAAAAEGQGQLSC